MKKFNPSLAAKAMILVLVIAIPFSCNSPSTTASGSSADSLQAAGLKMQSYIDQDKLSGISVLTLKDGEVLHQNTVGLANIEEERKLEEDAIFRIYSMSKPITAAALMILYDKGKFQLDDAVEQYIPEFASTMVREDGREVPQKEAFTIRHLLTHTAGFSYGWDPSSHVDSLYNTAYEGGIWNTPNLATLVKLLATLPLKNQPGSKWEYSVSIDVAGYLVEVLSGLPFDVFLQTRLFGPLKMMDTGFDVPEEKYSRLAMIYTEEEGSGTLSPVYDLTNGVKKEVTLFSGGGGLVSTIGDYARFGQMLLNGGELDGVRVLQESTVKLIVSDQMPSTTTYNKGMGYGLGGQVNLETGEYSWSGMAATFFSVNPADNMLFLAFTQYIPSAKYPFAYEYQDLVRKALN